MNKKNIYILIIICCVAVLSFFFFSGKNTSFGKKNVVFWTLQMGTFDNYIHNVILNFEKENPDIHITWVDVPYSEGEKRTLASILSDTPPDLVNLTPEFSILLAQRKALVDIPKEDMISYQPALANNLKYNGEYFGVPFYATSALTFYNKKILKKAKVKDIPKSYDDMYAKAVDIKVKTGAFVTMPALTENDTTLKLLNKYNLCTPTNIASIKSVDLFNEYKFLYQNNFIPQESITQSHREALEKYMAGQLAYLPAGANFLNIVKENAPKVYEVTGISTQLVGDTGKYDFSLMNFVVPKKAKNPEAALKFALYLTNTQNQLELAKLTAILPVNDAALKSPYLSKPNDKNDLAAQARYLSAQQLNKLQPAVPQTKNQKELLTLSNNYVQQILLGKAPTLKLLKEFSAKWKKLL